MRNSIVVREQLWNRFKIFASSFEGPWIVVGDFNCVKIFDEKLGGIPPQPSNLASFNKCLSLCRLDDIQTLGSFLTWTNKKDGSNHIQGKLDRHFVNKHWELSIPSSFSLVLERGINDHPPIE